MSDILCSYQDREAVLMSYLYDEIAAADREAFDAHLATCARCRVELNGLGGVRAQLARWAAPDYLNSPQSAVGSAAVGSRAVGSASIGRPVPGQLLTIVPSSSDQQRASSGERGSWRDWPAWAQAAAAVLVLGVSAGAANLNVHYDAQNGLNVRTGWSHEPEQKTPATASAAAQADAVSRTELAALEQQLRSEIQAAAAATPAAARAVSSADIDARRVKTLLNESERRHEREMALRIAEVIRDVNAQRQSDLVKIDQNLGLIDRRNDIEVRKNRQMIDMYLQRVSQRQ